MNSSRLNELQQVEEPFLRQLERLGWRILRGDKYDPASTLAEQGFRAETQPGSAENPGIIHAFAAGESMKIDQIIRTKRKTYAVIVKRDGSLVVRAPLNATDSQIEAVVQKKEAWIKEKQALIVGYYPRTSGKEFVNGEGFLYLGQSYQLAIVGDQSEPLKLAGRFYLARSSLELAQEVFIAWYRQRALEVFSERAAWYADRHGFTYQRVKIMNARYRWGSCGPKGSLNFAWRLVMSPLKVVDYVVIHELVHLQERNHSKAFWERIKTIMPDYSQQIAWLERYGHTLSLNGSL